MSRRLRDFSTILEKTLIAERAPAARNSSAARPRLRPEDQIGILWEPFRKHSSAEERALMKVVGECA